MTKKLFKIWAEDLDRHYHKTSFLMRVIICALIAFGVSQYAIKKHIKPLQIELKAIADKLKNTTSNDNYEFIIMDSKSKQRRTQNRINTLRKENDELANKCGNLSINDTARVIIDVRSLIDNNSLRIISEDRAKPIVEMPKKRGRKNNITAIKDTRIKPAIPSFIDTESYVIKIVGRYDQIRNFLIEAYGNEKLFLINNIKIINSKELVTDRNLKQHKAVECTFEVHIPYKKGK